MGSHLAQICLNFRKEKQVLRNVFLFPLVQANGEIRRLMCGLEATVLHGFKSKYYVMPPMIVCAADMPLLPLHNLCIFSGIKLCVCAHICKVKPEKF